MDKILEKALKRYDIACKGWSEIYDAALDDARFVHDVDGGQWDAKSRQDRAGKRPMLTINKLQKFVRKLRSEMRMNKLGIKVIPVDNIADPNISEIYNGILRMIEYLSTAEISYDIAYSNAVATSIGFFKLVTEYEDNNSFNQEIKIKRIMNPLSVKYDPLAEEYNLEDAQYCFVDHFLTTEDFKDKYKGAATSSVDKGNKGQQNTMWFLSDKIKVSEYYYKEIIKKKIGILDDESNSVIELTKNNMERIKYYGLKIVREREIENISIKRCILSGMEVLEEPVQWMGDYIPIIPVFGDEVIVNGKKYIQSLIRGAKDPQRMYNHWSTAATEHVAMSPKSPFIVENRQIKGFEQEWHESNVSNRMFVRYNYVHGLQKPSREPPPSIPTAIVEMMRNANFEIEDQLGKYEASKGAPSNERSGLAITKRVIESDKGSYVFIDNMTRALIYACKQIVNLIPKIYDGSRVIRILDGNNNHQMVNINYPSFDYAQGKPYYMNDLSIGKYDVISTAGITYASKRQEIVDAMIQAMQYAPMLANRIAPLIFKYSDWPGAEEITQQLDEERQLQQQMQAIQKPPITQG